MSTTVTYQCPNCSAGLQFDPVKGKFACEYCLSEFTEQELAETETARAAEDAASDAARRAAEESEQVDEAYSEALSGYTCSACGAELIADKSTVATFCPYCHNPVLMAGELAGQMRPHKVIPFKIDRDGAEKAFLDYAGKKKFLPKDFLSEKQLSHITGIYYPFWVTDADVGATMSARATRVRSWRAGDYRYTETSRYHIRRAGEIHFEDIVTPALTEEDREMLDGILPYPSDSLQAFSMPYLSGFVAKKRNLEQASVRDAVYGRMQGYAQSLLQGTILGYTTVTPESPRLLTRSMHWDYTLMPIWILTYKHRQRSFTYAINGYTGKIYGRFPLSGKRLSIFSALVGVAAGLLSALIAFLAL